MTRLSEGEATVGELAAPFDMTLQAVSQHIGVLERCGLVSRGRHRQTRPCRPEPQALEGAVSWRGSRRAGGCGPSGPIGSRDTPHVSRGVGSRRRARAPSGPARARGAGPLDGIVVELRAGGRFETLMVGDHGSHRMVATFTEVAPTERVAGVEPASGLHTTGTLTDLGDGRTQEDRP